MRNHHVFIKSIATKAAKWLSERDTVTLVWGRVRQLPMRVSLMSYGRLEIAVHRTFGLVGSKTLRGFVKFIARCTPISLVKFIPRGLSSICSSYALGSANDKNRIEIWLKNIEDDPAYRKVFIHRKLHFLFQDSSEDQFLHTLEEMFKNPDQRVFVNEWIYFNLNQQHVIDHLKKSKLRLEGEKGEQSDYRIRYLPDHTKHMGHLGFLYLYSQYYGARDPSRTVAIWPHLAPNSFYLTKVIEHAPLNFKLMPKESWAIPIHEDQKDTIMMSRVKEFCWRFEPLVAAGTAQEFPEFDIQETSLLMPDLASHDTSEQALASIGFDPNRWFVILHVKEDKLGYAVSGETRDASVYEYIDACRIVRDLGGQVVRMGSPSFPKLSRNFPAVDYAHSSIRTDYIDYWLWANCLSWVGNLNGASTAVIPFGKPRLITNQWPFDSNGPSKDYVLPKFAYSEKKKRYLTFNEAVEGRHGRSMNRSLLEKNGIKLVNNPPGMIAQSLLELISSKGTLKVDFKSTKIDLELYSATKTPLRTPRMTLTESYRETYQNIQNEK